MSSQYMSDQDVNNIIGKIFRKEVTIQDVVNYVAFELSDALDTLNNAPKEMKDGIGWKPTFHAECCVLRAFSATLRLRDILKSTQDYQKTTSEPGLSDPASTGELRSKQHDDQTAD